MLLYDTTVTYSRQKCSYHEINTWLAGTDIGARRRNEIGQQKRGEGIIIHTIILIKVNVTGPRH